MHRLKVLSVKPSIDFDSGNMVLSLEIDREDKYKAETLIDELSGNDKPLSVEVKKWHKKRSLDANRYCWNLCSEIAKKVGTTKEEVYRESISLVGAYEPLPIKSEAVETFRERWGSKGTGWIVEVVDDSKLEGYKFVRAYYGSSTYSTKEMSALIDNLIQDAKAVGVEVISEQERSLLLDEWGACG